MSNKKFQRSKLVQAGFTIPEVSIVTSIFLLLFGFVVINVINSQHRTSVSSNVEVLIADIKSQQIKAMVGATEGRVNADAYGIHFGSISYTLFHGLSYSPSDPDNFVVSLDQNLQFVNDKFPNADLIFSRGSGEVQGFVSGQNAISITDSNNTNQKTITVNRFGAILSVN